MSIKNSIVRRETVPARIQVPGLRMDRLALRKSSPHPWSFALPAITIFSIFFLAPTLLTFVYPFTNWSAFHDSIKWVGFDNFSSILSDGSLTRSIRVTLVYAALVTVFQNIFGLGLAVLLERDTAVNRALRVVFFIPALLSALAVGYIFRALLIPEGPLNQLISGFTGQSFSFPWLGDTTWTLVVVSLIHSWKWMGLTMLIYIAGLKSVPDELLEAAAIDGASRFRRFTSVKFPLLAPAVTVNVTLTIAGTLNSFDVIQATTGGGPAQSTETFNIYMFQLFGQGLYAQAAAISLILFLVIILITGPIIFVLRRREVQL